MFVFSRSFHCLECNLLEVLNFLSFDISQDLSDPLVHINGQYAVSGFWSQTAWVPIPSLVFVAEWHYASYLACCGLLLSGGKNGSWGHLPHRVIVRIEITHANSWELHCTHSKLSTSLSYYLFPATILWDKNYCYLHYTSEKLKFRKLNNLRDTQ